MPAALLRRLRGSARAHRLLGALGAGYVRLCRATGRWQVIGAPRRDATRSGRGRVILAFWHGRLMMVASEAGPGIDVRAIVSRNRDGDLIAGILGRFGVATIRGSSRDPRKADRDKGGAAVLREAVTLLARHRDIVLALTPDGPRGPAEAVQGGVAALSVHSGVPVVPWAFSARPALVLPSWDRFLLPLPFARGAIAYGEPVVPPAPGGDGAVEAHRAAIEAALRAVTEAADVAAGRTRTRSGAVPATGRETGPAPARPGPGGTGR